MGQTELGRRLRVARLSKGLTLETVARRVGISFPYLAQLEKGIAKGLNVEVVRRIVTRGLGERWEDWEDFVAGYRFEYDVNTFLRARPDLTEESKRAIRIFMKAAWEVDRKALEEQQKRRIELERRGRWEEQEGWNSG